MLCGLLQGSSRGNRTSSFKFTAKTRGPVRDGELVVHRILCLFCSKRLNCSEIGRIHCDGTERGITYEILATGLGYPGILPTLQ